MARAKKSPTRTAPTTDGTILNPVHGCIRFNSACIANVSIDMEAGTISAVIKDAISGRTYLATGTIEEQEG